MGTGNSLVLNRKKAKTPAITVMWADSTQYVPSTPPRLEVLPYHQKEAEQLLLRPQRFWVVYIWIYTHTLI